jgi:hypothetical protein
MTTRTVTGIITKPDGSVYTTEAAKFRLVKPILSSGAFALTNTVEVTTDNTGAFSVALLVPDTGAAIYEVVLADGACTTVNLAGGASITLQTMLSVPVVPDFGVGSFRISR